ncbi:MAG TPA: DUF4240 domain-containing protein [Micromonosporaceae bacterium]
MDIDRFWALIEQARTAAGPAADQAVRDFDDPDDDPDRDYWDFSDLELDEFQLSTRGNGSAAIEADPTGGDEAGGHDIVDLDEDDDDVEDDDEEDDDDEDDDDEEEGEELADPVAAALVELLSELPAAEIAEFDNLFEEMREQADRADLANAAALIEHGFLGDDSFEDFRAGLVALGRETYERALADPDSLADHPLVQEIAQANDPRWLGREDLLYAAAHAYTNVTGEDEVSFIDFAEGMRPEVSPDDGGDAEHSDPEWDLADEAETKRRLPRLTGMFYVRSMHNRQRAIEKLGLDQ